MLFSGTHGARGCSGGGGNEATSDLAGKTEYIGV
jgi:hypothetical protein